MMMSFCDAIVELAGERAAHVDVAVARRTGTRRVVRVARRARHVLHVDHTVRRQVQFVPGARRRSASGFVDCVCGLVTSIFPASPRRQRDRRRPVYRQPVRRARRRPAFGSTCSRAGTAVATAAGSSVRRQDRAVRAAERIEQRARAAELRAVRDALLLVGRVVVRVGVAVERRVAAHVQTVVGVHRSVQQAPGRSSTRRCSRRRRRARTCWCAEFHSHAWNLQFDAFARTATGSVIS